MFSLVCGGFDSQWGNSLSKSFFVCGAQRKRQGYKAISEKIYALLRVVEDEWIRKGKVAETGRK